MSSSESAGPSRPGEEIRRARRWLVAILAVSLGARVWLAALGGALFFTDEGRYAGSRAAARLFAQGQVAAGLDKIFSQADHVFFKFLGVLPALVELPFGDCPMIAAVFFGLFSVALLWLEWRLALALGADAWEALASAAALACCASYLYYARHIFPYDAGMAFAVLGLLLALRPGALSSYLAGVFAGLAFITYNGYWQTAGAFLLCAAWSHRSSLAALARYAALGIAGLLTPIGLVIGIGRAFHHDLVASYIAFSGTTMAGDFGGSWLLAARYYWASEHLLTVVWATSAAAAGFALLRGTPRRWPGFVLAMLAIVAFGIFAPDDLLRKIVVMARHTRALPIVFSLLVGWAFAGLLRAGVRGRAAAVFVAAVIVGNLVAGLWLPFKLHYPEAFRRSAAGFIARASAEDGGRYRVIDATFFSTPSEVTGVPAHSRVVHSEAHPLAYVPYLYDGWNDELRRGFLAMRLRMRIVELLPEDPRGRPQLPDTGGPWRPYPGAVHLEVVLDASPISVGEPLVTTGVTGAGESVYFVRTDPTHLRVGYDNWGRGAVLSPLLPCDPLKSHAFDVSFGGLYPPQRPSSPPGLPALRSRARISYDGQLVLDQATQSWPSEAAAIRYFRNPIGMSSSEPEFAGRVLNAEGGQSQ